MTPWQCLSTTLSLLVGPSPVVSQQTFSSSSLAGKKIDVAVQRLRFLTRECRENRFFVKHAKAYDTRESNPAPQLGRLMCWPLHQCRVNGCPGIVLDMTPRFIFQNIYFPFLFGSNTKLRATWLWFQVLFWHASWLSAACPATSHTATIHRGTQELHLLSSLTRQHSIDFDWGPGMLVSECAELEHYM